MVMIDNLCPRCDSRFYTALNMATTCPFCGYVLKFDRKHELRLAKRALIRRECALLDGEEKSTGETVDISMDGIGISMVNAKAFKKDDMLRVVVEDFDIDSNARVVWITQSGSGRSNAGLKFVEAVS